MDEPNWEARALDAEAERERLTAELDTCREQLRTRDEQDARLEHLRTLFPTAIDPELAARAALDLPDDADDETLVRSLRTAKPWLWTTPDVVTTGDDPDPRSEARDGARRQGDRTSLLRYLKLRAS